jgi:hypothetical protein
MTPHLENQGMFDQIADASKVPRKRAITMEIREERLDAIVAKTDELLSRFPRCESTAGWRSTKAAITGLRQIAGFNGPGKFQQPGVMMVSSYTEAIAQLDEIINAWEGLV